jgi:hypothetical protein
MSIARDIAHWLATTTRKGPVELATQSEVDTGADSDRAVTSATLRGTAIPGGLMGEQVFTVDGTWTKPTGCQLVEVYAVGAGGGSAGVEVTGTPEWRFGGGGGGGGSASAFFLASEFGATVTVQVGVGGSGGATGNNAGSAGEDSTFNGTTGTFLRGYGGGGGGTSAADSFGSGGSGGAAGGGGYETDTEQFNYGQHSRGPTIGQTHTNMAGGGANGRLSGPARQVSPSGATGWSDQGIDAAANSHGAGADGASIRDQVSDEPGGDGADGIVIVREYG